MAFETSTLPYADPRIPADRDTHHDPEKDAEVSPDDCDTGSADIEKSDEQQSNGDIEKGLPASQPIANAQQESPAPEQPPKDPSLVEFDGPDDPGNPKNWSVRKRLAMTVSMAMMVFVVVSLLHR